MPRSVWNDITSTPSINDHHIKEEDYSEVVLKCPYMVRIGLDILWSVNKLARAITKWTKACDKRLNRLISYIHHTNEYTQYCHVGNAAKQRRLGLFKTLTLREILKIRNPFLEEHCVCCQVIFQMDQDNLIVMFVNVIMMKDIDSVLSNVQSARQEVLLYVFEDNEAVIKMIFKSSSSTMNTSPEPTELLLTGCSTIRIFTRDEWNHLLNLFNICHFISEACTAAMAKRAQQESGEERVTAKSRPMMNLTAKNAFVRVFFSFIKPSEDFVWRSRS